MISLGCFCRVSMALNEDYGGGRFLDAVGPDANNKVIMDFNRATIRPALYTLCYLPAIDKRK